MDFLNFLKLSQHHFLQCIYTYIITYIFHCLSWLLGGNYPVVSNLEIQGFSFPLLFFSCVHLINIIK